MKNRSKVIGISIGALALCLMILAVGLLIFVNTDQFRHILLNKINASIAGNLAVGRHDISFLKGRVALQNVTLEAAPGNRLATLEYLRVDIAFLPLLTRTLFIESMTLERPDIQIKMDKNGVVDIVEAFKAPSKPQKVQTQQPSSTPFDVIAQDIRITNGACDVTLEPDNLHADLDHITLQAKADLLKKTGRIELKIEDTALTYGARHLDINPVTLSVMLPEGRPASVAFKAKTDAAEIALNGDVSQDFHNPSLNLDLTFDVSLSKLKNFMPLPAEFSGKTNGVLTVRGPWRDPDADLRLNYSGGRVSSGWVAHRPAFEKPSTSGAATGTFGRGRCRQPCRQCRLAGRVTGGAVFFTGTSRQHPLCHGGRCETCRCRLPEQHHPWRQRFFNFHSRI